MLDQVSDNGPVIVEAGDAVTPNAVLSRDGDVTGVDVEVEQGAVSFGEELRGEPFGLLTACDGVADGVAVRVPVDSEHRRSLLGVVDRVARRHIGVMEGGRGGDPETMRRPER